jgi:uncharacterized protein (DUF433 family)
MYASESAERVFSGKEMDRLLAAQYRSGMDSREQALYTVPEAARFLGIQPMTLATWVYGRTYWTKAGRKFWERVIAPADPKMGLLSFFNLAEAHILAATRYKHKVPFPSVRTAIANVIDKYPIAKAHPLLSHDFYTDGKYLFIKTIEETVDLSSAQLPLKQIMDYYLERVVRDEQDNPFKVYPIVPGVEVNKVVSIISGVSSSRPVIDGTGVQVAIVWRRFKAGEQLEALAEDFEIPLEKVKRAIEYVEWRAA